MTTPNVASVAKPISLSIVKEINGAWFADMTILPDDYLSTESYVDIDNGSEVEEYIVKRIKKIKSGGKHYYDVYLEHNMSELADVTLDRIYQLKPVNTLLPIILSGSGWTAGTCDITDTVQIDFDRRVSVLEALTTFAIKAGGELYFHSKERIVDLKYEIGNVTKLQIRYDKNCDEIIKEEDSSELITRIYPYGADNFSINTTILDDCEDETLYTASGAGSKAASDFKMSLTQGIQINPAALNETFIRDLGAGGIIDLSDHNLLKLWIYSAVDNASGFTFGIGESAYTENVVNTGALTLGCWHEISLDLSGVANASKNAIRYIGFKNLTNGAASIVFDKIQSFHGNIYIDSANASLYKVKKEFVYNHSAKVEKTSTTVKVYSSEDTSSSQNNPDATNGISAGLAIRGGVSSGVNSACYTYLKFDTSAIPTGATIVSATLYLDEISIDDTPWYDLPGGTAIKTYKPTSNWAEGTLTWNNQPANDGADLHTWDMSTVGIKNSGTDLKTTFENWWNGFINNYGLVLLTTEQKWQSIGSRRYPGHEPYFEVVYTLPVSPEPVIKASAELYLNDHDEPKLKYAVKVADLPRVMVDTWEDEIMDIGDTVRVYDFDLDINTDCRIKKITKDLFNPENGSIELTNKAYTMADLEAKRAKQLSYAMPFLDDSKIINANAIQKGYFGSGVNV